MIYFGPKRYYKLTILDMGTRSSVWIDYLRPLKGGARWMHPVTAPSSGHVERDILHLRNHLGEIDHTGYSTVADTNPTTFNDVVHQIQDAGWYVTAAGLPVSGTIILDSAVYYPLWVFSVGSGYVVDVQMSVSDDGVAWTDIGPFHCGPEFYGTHRWILEVGQGYQTRTLAGAYQQTPLHRREKQLCSSYAMTGFRLEDKELYSSPLLPGAPRASFAAQLGDAEWRLSGGQANTDPTQSLGGEMSDTVALSQVPRTPTPLPGVTLTALSSNPRGWGTLYTLVDAGGEFWVGWRPSGGLTGWTHIRASGKVSVLSGGGAATGYITVQVNLAVVAMESQSTRVWVDNGNALVFQEVSPSQAEAGAITYRCLYLHNASATGKFENLVVYLRYESISSTGLRIGLAPEGINGTPVGLGSESDAPAGVVFSAPTEESPLEVGTLVWGRSIPVWVERKVPSGSTDKYPHDLSIIGFRATLK